MDKSVPAGAALLLDFIARIETSREVPDRYAVIYGHNEGDLAKPITSMTLDEVIAAQRGWTRAYGSSAAGAYQFMRATLTGLKEELGLKGTLKLDANLQDRLGYHLLKRRGYAEFVAGKIGAVEFGKRLAQEWASLPVLADTKRGKVKVVRGASYYAGDGLNKSLVKPVEVETLLNRVWAQGNSPAAPEEPVVLPGSPETPATAATPASEPAAQQGEGFQINWLKVGVLVAIGIGLASLFF